MDETDNFDGDKGSEARTLCVEEVAENSLMIFPSAHGIFKELKQARIKGHGARNEHKYLRLCVVRLTIEAQTTHTH